MAKEAWESTLGRTYWKDDEAFVHFNNRMLRERFTFEEILELSTFGTFDFVEEIDWEPIKDDWEQLVKTWNDIEGIVNDDPVKAMGFTGLTYLVCVFPFDKLVSGDVFSQNEVNILTIIPIYNNRDYLPFKNLPDLISYPVLPAAWQQWIDGKYNSASWWTTYIVYERNHGLPHVINPDERAELK